MTFCADKLTLISPSIGHKAEAVSYINETKAAGEYHVNGSCAIERAASYEEWLDSIIRMSRGDTAAGWVFGEVLFAVRERDGKLVGMINNRYETNVSLIEHDGHIGYSVRPLERQRGYASEMLRLALPYYKERGFKQVLVTCNESNKASAKVITNNGGEYESSEWDEDEGEPVRRYWIKLQ